jgi:hypothetical protein
VDLREDDRKGVGSPMHSLPLLLSDAAVVPQEVPGEETRGLLPRLRRRLDLNFMLPLLAVPERTAGKGGALQVRMLRLNDALLPSGLIGPFSEIAGHSFGGPPKRVEREQWTVGRGRYTKISIPSNNKRSLCHALKVTSLTDIEWMIGDVSYNKDISRSDSHTDE